MANEFIIRKGYKSLASSEVTGSLLITGSATINAAADTTPFTIQGSSHKYVDITTTTNNQVGIRMTDDSVTYLMGLHGGENAFKISKNSTFGTNDYFNIDADGKVGIGTTTPSELLSVQGNVSASAYYGDGSNLTGISIDGGNATTLDSLDSTQFLRSDADDTATGTITIASSGASEGKLILGSSSQTNHTLQQWQTSAHGTNEAYIIAYGAGHSSQAGNFAMKNLESGKNIFFELAGGVVPLKLESTLSTFANSINLTAGSVQLRGDAALDHDGSSLYVKAPSAIYFYPGNSNKANLNTAGTLTLAGNLDVNGTGTSTIDGNLTVAGTVTAQEFHAEFVSSSIIYESGSTKFGDTSDDNHNFTGSLIVNRNPGSSQGNVMIIQNTGDYGSSQDLVIKNTFDRDVGIKFQTGGGEYYQWLDSNGDDSLVFTAAGTNRTNDATLILKQDHSVTIPNGGLSINTINQAASDTDKFLVSDSGVIKYRSGSQVLSDIGAAASSHTHAATDITSGLLNNSRLNSNVFINDGGTYSSGYTGDMDSVTGFRVLRSTSGQNRAFSSHHNVLNLPNTSATSYEAQLAMETGGTGLAWRGSSNGTFTGWYTIWHSGNDGPTSGLSAQTAATASYVAASNIDGSVTTAATASYYDETDTLDSVTDRGSSTANGITVGNTIIRASATPTLTLDDNGNAGGGGAEGLILFKNNDGNAIGLGYTADVTSTSDLLISTDASSTYGGYLGLDVAAIDDPSSIILDPKTEVVVTKDLIVTGDITVNGSHLELINGSNAAPQTTDYLFIGGDNLASADGAIYLGNRGDGTGYGYRIYYSGVGSGNNNKLILKSENLGSNVDMLTFTADGASTFANNVSVEGQVSASSFIGDGSGLTNITSTTATTASNAMLLDGIDSTAFLRSDESDTMSGNLSLEGNLLLTGTATTTNQSRMIDFTGFDKEGTTDFTDRAYIAHTTNTGGHAGSVLVISSQNDSNDGIAFATNASSNLKHNGNVIWTAGNDGPTSGLAAQTAATASYYDETDTLATVTGRGSSTSTSVRFSNDLNYFGLASTNNEGEIVINTGQAGSPQIGFTEHGDASWAIGIDDGDNSFKIHGTANATIPTLNNLASPLFEITTGGDVIATGDLTINGGNIAVNSNNGGVLFNDVSSYWLRTATNWGLYWDTSNNQIQFHGSGNSRAFIDLDTGRIQGNEHGIFANNVYAGGTEGFVFGSSTSEGEYIKRVGNDIQFVAGGSTRMTVDGDDGRVGIGTTSPEQALDVKGNIILSDAGFDQKIIFKNSTLGTGPQITTNTSAFLKFLNSAGTSTMQIDNGGDVLIGTGPLNPGARLHVTGSNNDESVVLIEGSGSTILDIQGSQGQLFSITDDLTGDLFSVSDISGIPILNVNASGDSYFDGNLDVSGSLKVTGSAFFNGSIGNSPAANPGVHIGVSDGNDGQIQIIGSSAHIDFSNAGSEDYDARIILEGNDELNVAGVGNNFQVNGNRVLTTADEGSYLNTSGTAQTKSGNLTINGNLYLGDQMRIGDDAWIEDFNVANAIKIKGNQNNANGYIAFGSQNDLLGRAGTGALTWAGNTIWHAGNDGPTSGLAAQTAATATTASNAMLFDGIDSERFIYGSGANKITGITDMNSRNNPSGFFEGYNISNSPTSGTWYNMINVRHSNTGNSHGFQIAASYYNEDIWTRTYQGGSSTTDGTYTTWRRLYHEGHKPTLSELGAAASSHTHPASQITTGTCSGEITFSGNVYIDNGTTNYIKLYTEAGTAQIADTFADTTTDKSYLYFGAGASSNDPGYIMHETSNSETNEGVLHLVPSDDNGYGDYVSIHGTNDPDKLKLHTDGTIEGVSNLKSTGYIQTQEIRATGQDLTITAGEANTVLGYGTHDDENIRLGAEAGVIVYSSTDNLTSGLNNSTTLIDSSGNMSVNNGQIKIGGGNLSFVASHGRGVRFWENDGYKIYMSGYSQSNIGGRLNSTSDYMMYFQMTGGTNRGFAFKNGNTVKAEIEGNGNIRTVADVIAYHTSDKMFKDNLTLINSPLDKINKIGGYTFEWNDKQESYDKGTQDVGVVAQEIEEVLPEIVTTRDNGSKAVKYEKIVPLLIEGIKEQQKQIDELKAIVNKLQNEK